MGRSVWPRVSALPTSAGAALGAPVRVTQAPVAGYPAPRARRAGGGARVRGQGTEFDSPREYVRGDDVRRRSAGVASGNRSVVVRTRQPERPARAAVLVP
ncbi:MAG: hypothetical protein R2734_13435 [Nocardioides sp.]